MPDDDLQLVDPCEELREAYLDFMAEYEAAFEPFREGPPDEIRRDFAGFLQKIRDHARGRRLPRGHVPGDRYWLVKDGRVLGTCSVRHSLTESLQDLGGHIGYGVRPGQRGKGYATAMLILAMDKARQRGLKRVRVTCNSDNPASARVIEKCGGVLESESIAQSTGKLARRYWIEL